MPFAGGLHADAPPTTLRIAPAGTDIEGLKNFGLEWNAVPNATYLLERADTLAPGSPWHLLDAIKPPDVAGSYQFSVMATDTSGFYRLVLPQPDISSVEPAVFTPGVAVDFWLIGQCFAIGDVVRVDGVAVGGVVFVNSGLLRFTLPPQSAGAHLVELVRGRRGDSFLLRDVRGRVRESGTGVARAAGNAAGRIQPSGWADYLQGQGRGDPRARID